MTKREQQIAEMEIELRLTTIQARRKDLKAMLRIARELHAQGPLKNNSAARTKQLSFSFTSWDSESKGRPEMSKSLSRNFKEAASRRSFSAAVALAEVASYEGHEVGKRLIPTEIMGGLWVVRVFENNQHIGYIAEGAH